MEYLKPSADSAQPLSCVEVRVSSGGPSVYLLDGRAVAPGDIEGWLAGAGAHLDPEEAARLKAFIFPEKRLEFLLGRILLRSVLAAFHGVPDARFALGPDGKPYLVARPGERPPPALNLSHSYGCLAAIVAPGGEVGIDIERVRPVSDDLARSTMHPAELAAIRAEEDFFRLWTAKEAYMKLLGAGLRIPPRQLAVDLAARTVRDLETGRAEAFRSFPFGGHIVTFLAA